MPWKRRQKGQALAELALVLPILLMVVFGMIEMARLVQTYLAVQHAAREAARYAVVGLPSEDECATAYGHSCQARLSGGEICPTEFSAFRVAAIKEKAKEAAIGLPWNPSATNPAGPRYLGVEVQGQPSFYDATALDCPGVPGARVRVMVFFNLPVITPLLSGALPTIRVSASTEMINEGFQTWVGAQAPPILSPMPTQPPLDSDLDGLPDVDEYAGACPYVDNPDSDYDGLLDGPEDSTLGWDPCNAWVPYTPTPEIDIPTPTNTATPTPVPLEISEPLRNGDTYVTGVGDPASPGGLQVWDTTTNTRIGYGSIETSGPSRGTFRISVTPLIAGHTIRVLASYDYDQAVVVGATNTPTYTPTSTNTPTPTATRTPTATPTPSTRITISSPPPPGGMIYSCTDNVGSDLALTVQGTGWPASSEVLFGWDGTGVTNRSYTGNAKATPAADGTFTANFTVIGSQVTAQKHTLYAIVILTGQQAQAPLYVPCSSVPTPTPTNTPTPTRTPTFTPTPVRAPDLVVTGLSVQGGVITTWTDVSFSATVFNDSTGPCNNFFWTDLYVYTDTVSYPAPGDYGVDWYGVSSLAAYSSAPVAFSHMFTISTTYYIYAQADTLGFVSEAPPNGELNNVSQPLTVTVIHSGPTPIPTATPTEDPNAGSISGTVWAFIGGTLVVPSERVNMSLWKGDVLLASGQSLIDGSYSFYPVSPETGYLVDGYVDIDGIPYKGYQAGIEVLPGQETSPVEVVLYPF